MSRAELRLDELLRAAGMTALGGRAGAATVRRVEYDSRRCGPGSLFVAIPGEHTDGHGHVADALHRGAVAAVVQDAEAVPSGIPRLVVADTRAAVAALAAVVSGRPSAAMVVAGVTGTDGKTTTTTMLHAAWRGAGLRAGSLTTVDFRVDDRIEPNTTRQTTLEAVDLQDRLAAMLTEGVDRVALETSSHALALHRVDGVDFDAAVYTRITSEHLEFHGSRAEYLRTKAMLLDRLGSGGVGVIDADDAFAAPVLTAIPVARRLLYSAAGTPTADLFATGTAHGDAGVHFVAHTPWGSTEVRMRVAGSFNVANALAALAAACATGAPFEEAVAGLEALARVGGRMERVDLGQPFAVVIDYAHTAEALATVLRELREVTPGRLWVVFGSAGERDREKRPAMGAVGAELADHLVLTDEDPRGEDRTVILEEIAAGARAAGVSGDRLVLIPDRAAAIAHAAANAQPGDTVLLAGKGHESCIIVGRDPVPWDERAVAEEALRRRLKSAR
ncbi:MAG: UDP-N-acetylmuramoyl-L-alanyl-D-glutamate--2,6-diaminopimelate ligase [Candidatus Dormibacteria bacterium]